MSKSKSKNLKTRRVNLCLSEAEYLFLLKHAKQAKKAWGKSVSVGRYLSGAIGFAMNLEGGGAVFDLPTTIRSGGQVVYEKRPWDEIRKADAKRKPTVSSPLNGLKSRKKTKIGV